MRVIARSISSCCRWTWSRMAARIPSSGGAPSGGNQSYRASFTTGSDILQWREMVENLFAVGKDTLYF